MPAGESPFNLVPPGKRQVGDARAKGDEVPKPARDWTTLECERRVSRNSKLDADRENESAAFLQNWTS